MTELEYLRVKCELQDKFIKGEIKRAKLDQELEILRLKYIEHLRARTEFLKNDIQAQAWAHWIDSDEFRKEIGFERKFHDNMGAEK